MRRSIITTLEAAKLLFFGIAATIAWWYLLTGNTKIQSQKLDICPLDRYALLS